MIAHKGTPPTTFKEGGEPESRIVIQKGDEGRLYYAEASATLAGPYALMTLPREFKYATVDGCKTDPASWEDIAALLARDDLGAWVGKGEFRPVEGIQIRAVPRG